ncbi:unnamed protein product, partial [Rotaria sp. Silwood2]
LKYIANFIYRLLLLQNDGFTSRTPDKIHKGKSIKKKTDIASVLTTTVSSTNAYSSTTTSSSIVIDNTKWKDLFNIEILNFKNESKKYANITEKQVTLFISGCHECKLKRTKPKNSSKLVLRPIISNDFNARGQVDLIDMQSCPDGHFKFILNYQDHFTKFCILRPLKTKTAVEVAFHLLDIFTTFGAPIILQSDNGREFKKVQNELNSAAIDTNLFHEDCCDHETEDSADYNRQNDNTQNKSDEDENGQDHTEQDDEQNDNEQDNQHLDKINNDKLSPLNNRIKRTNAVRQVAREGQKRQADEFLQSTAKKQKLANFNVGDNVLVPVPDVDRGPTDARNVLAVIMEIKHDKLKLGTEKGILFGYHSYHEGH